MAPKAAIVTVGDELLLGETVDTNAAWLGRRLAAVGIPVERRATVGDDRGAIGEAVAAAAAAVDLVLVTGGLGPTSDDVTREAVAERLGRPLRLDEGLLAALRERFERRGYRFAESNRSQAQVPEGAVVLANPHGTAPGLAMEADESLVVLLPGVPRELRGIFEGDLGALLRVRFADRLRPVHMTLIHTTGIPESVLAERVAELLPADLGPVRIAYLPDLRGVDLRLTATGVTEDEARARFREIENALSPAIGRARYAAASGDLAETVLDALRMRGLTLAVAESCTGGLVGKRITDVPGASDLFLGGVVAYHDAVKTGQLGVDPELIAREGAVSEAVALQMARGAVGRLGSDAAVGVTGVAGPGGGTEEKPVGTVWVAAVVGTREKARRLGLPGDREAVRERSAQAALALLLEVLSEEGVAEPPAAV